MTKKSLTAIDMDTSQFVAYVRKHFNKKYKTRDIMAVLTILLEEMEKDLLQNQEIQIKNFGSFQIKKRADSRMMHVITKVLVPAIGKYKLSFTFWAPLMKDLLSMVIVQPTSKPQKLQQSSTLDKPKLED